MDSNAGRCGSVLNPVGDVRVVRGKLAGRLQSLDGKTIIFMDDNVGPQEPFWKRLGMRLEESFQGCKTIDRISSGSEPLPMNEIEEIADRADAVVVGVAL